MARPVVDGLTVGRAFVERATAASSRRGNGRRGPAWLLHGKWRGTIRLFWGLFRHDAVLGDARARR